MQTPAQALERALHAHRAGRLDEAERAYAALLANTANDGDAGALDGHTAAGRTVEGLAAEGLAAEGRPTETDPSIEARYWLGVLHLQRQRAADARDCFLAVLACRPGHDAARLNLGYAWQRLGDDAAACQAFAHAANATSQEIVVAAHAALGRHAAAAGRPTEALHHFEQALTHAPGQAGLHDGRGLALAALGRYDLAEQAHRAALALRPRHPGTHNNLGLAVKAQGQRDASLWHFRDALRIDPDFVPALVNLGHAVALGGDPDQASAPLERAVRLAPDCVPAHHELAQAYAALDRQEDAARHFALATEYDPAFALGWQNLASARFETGDHAAALAAVAQALRLDPTLALARFTRGVLRLAQGGDRQAWRDYEARLEVWAPSREFAVPRWPGLPPDVTGTHMPSGARAGDLGMLDGAALDGAALEGAALEGAALEGAALEGAALEGVALTGIAPTVLVHAEQGLGDTLQFFRFVPLLAARGVDVVLDVPAPLHRLLAPAAVAAGVRLLDEQTPVPPVDAQCPLASLPLALGIYRPPDAPPYLYWPEHAAHAGQSSAGRAPAVRSWAGRVVTRLTRRDARRAGPLRMGLAWSGRRPDLTRRRSDDIAALPVPAFDKRAVPLDALSPLFALPDITWVVLQTEIDAPDRATLTDHAQRAAVEFASDTFGDFADTATTVATLDQVLSIDTSVAHLAGALGAPLAVMLPLAADWRWEARDATGANLWYPAARLFRQRARGDWSDVVQAVAEMLASAATRATGR